MYSKGEFVGALEVYKDVLQQVCVSSISFGEAEWLQEEEGSENGAMCVAGECGTSPASPRD